MNTSRVFFPFVVSLLFLQAASASDSQPIFVAANGVDSATCGAVASPCRTITQALAIAPSGGSVAVDPGIYGDVNGDGILSGNDEEPGTDVSMIQITKPVHLFSTLGAAVTRIDGGFAKSVAVQIDSNNVVFGAENGGFTLTGSSNAALIVDVVDNVAVIGNLALENSGRGFLLFSGGVIRASGNRAIANGNTGFFANAFSPGNYAVLIGNVAIGNDQGFELAGSNAPHQMINNIASNNVSGVFILPGPSRVIGNTLSGNGTGIVFDAGTGDTQAPASTVTHNNIVGSRAIGVNSFVDGSFAPPKFSENNIFGTSITPANPTVGCGVTNRTSFTFDARKNYWGAATGPGAKPADATCEGPVLTAPFATKPFVVP